MIFSKEQKQFLGKYFLQKEIDDYGVAIKHVLRCEDGKNYEYKVTGYGLDSINPYYQYEEANKKFIEQINEDMNK